MSSGDLRSKAESLDHEIAVLEEKIAQAEQSFEREKNRIETDIAAAQSKIDSLAPYADNDIGHTKEIADWQRRIDELRQQWERESMKMNANLEQLRREHEAKKAESAHTWAECENAKAAEDRQRVLILAQRAQDPNIGTSSDQLAA